MRRFGGIVGIRAGGLLALLLSVALVMAACGASTGGASTGGSSTGAGTGSASATATPQPTKAPPTTLPTIDDAFCQSMLTVEQANQLMTPATPATSIVVDSSGASGACYYVTSTQDMTLDKIVLLIYLTTYTGPKPATQQDIDNALAQSSSQAQQSISSFTIVNGVGDQAAFMALNVSEGSVSQAYAYYTLTGNILAICESFSSSASAATQQGLLQQCAQKALAVL